jgi:hypothetical protein
MPIISYKEYQSKLIIGFLPPFLPGPPSPLHKSPGAEAGGSPAALTRDRMSKEANPLWVCPP